MVESRTPPTIPANLINPSIEGILENPVPPYHKSYKITSLSIFRHIIYWSFASLIIFLITKTNHTLNEASAITFIAVLILFVIFNIGCWIASRFYDVAKKCDDPRLLSQEEMDNIERELSEVKERLNQAKDIFNAAESPEAQEEARTRMTELYVAKQTLSKTYSQQAIIRPKLMFLIVYGTPFVQINGITDLEANETNARITQNDTAPLIVNPQQQQPSSSSASFSAAATSGQPSSSGINNQNVIEESQESLYGSTVALVEKRKDSDNSDTNVF